MSIGNLEEIDSLMEMLGNVKERPNFRERLFFVPEFEQFEDVFRNPLVAIGPALWLVGRWAKMGWCQQKPKKLEPIIEIR